MVAVADVRRTRCSVCSSPHRAEIEALRAAKMTFQDIHLATQKMGRGYKRETLGKHFNICLKGETPFVDARAIANASQDASTQAELDFATLVQKRAAAMLAEGNLKVTASHGLQAQSLLDRRVEKAADRDLALNMARLLSGSVIMAPQEVIEGRAIEVFDVESLHDGLAPAEVVDA